MGKKSLFWSVGVGEVVGSGGWSGELSGELSGARRRGGVGWGGGIGEAGAGACGLSDGGLIGGGGFGANVGGRLGSGLGDGGSELGGFDFIFIGGEGAGQFGDSFSGGEGEGTIAEASAFGGVGEFGHELFVGSHGLISFIVATIKIGEFHEDAKAVAGFFFSKEIEGVVVEADGIFFLVEIAVDIGAALEDDFVFGKVFEELGNGATGFGEGASVGEEASFTETKPGKIGGVGSLGGIEIFVKVSGEGAVEGISDKGDHPREGELGLVGGLCEREAGEERANEEIDVRGEAEVGLVDCAHGGGGSVSEEGADPVFGFGANGFGAERVDVVGDGASTEPGGGHFEGAVTILGVPTCVESDLVPGGVFGNDVGPSVNFDFESAGLEEKRGAFDPVIAHAVGIVFFLDGAEVEEGAAGEFCFFGIDRILDHAANDGGGRAVEAGDEDHVVGEELAEGSDTFVREVGVGD